MRLLTRAVSKVSGVDTATAVSANTVTTRPIEATGTASPEAMVWLSATTEASLAPKAKAAVASVARASFAWRGDRLSASMERVPVSASSMTTLLAPATIGIDAVVTSSRGSRPA